VYSGGLATYSTTILASAFPIWITVSPSNTSLYQMYTLTGITATNAANLQIILAPVMNSVKFTVNANSV